MNEIFSHQGDNITYSKILIETNSQSITIEDVGHTVAYTTFSLGVPLKHYKEIYDKLSDGQAKLVIYTNSEIRSVGRMMCGPKECGK